MSYHDPRKYPVKPGHKGGDTSEAAAEAMAAVASRLRHLTLRTLASLGTASVLEVVERTGRSRWSIQPRMSELHNLGMIRDIGARRRNESGKMAKIWELTALGHLALGRKGGGDHG